MEQSLQKRSLSRKNEPSPGSYEVEKSIDKTQGRKSFQVKITNSKFLKFTGEKTLITLVVELIAQQKKQVPAVGQYDIEKSLDRISKPRGYK